MYHAHRYAKQGWAGEPEIDPLAQEKNDGSRGFVAQELLPRKCLELAYDEVLHEPEVLAGTPLPYLPFSDLLIEDGLQDLALRVLLT